MSNSRKAFAYLYFGSADRDKHEIFNKIANMLSENQIKKIMKEIQEEKNGKGKRKDNKDFAQ